MRFVCKNCHAKYKMDDEKVGLKSIQVRCRKCHHIIQVPSANASQNGAAAVPPPTALKPSEEGHSSHTLAEKADTVGANFFGDDEDDIGAVFDEVFGFAQSPPDNDEKAEAHDIAKAEGSQPTHAPEANWYVLVHEKQTGPLSLEKIKEHWDKGNIGPNSLCWRSGFADWIPIAQVETLSSVLPPQLSQLDAKAPSTSAPPEETGSWKPSAAKTLASLAKDEVQTLKAPDLKNASVVSANSSGADSEILADTALARHPSDSRSAAHGVRFNAPAMTRYRPPSNRNLIIAMSVVGGVIVLILIGLVAWVTTRTPQVVVAAPAPLPKTSPPTTPKPLQQPSPTQAQPSTDVTTKRVAKKPFVKSRPRRKRRSSPSRKASKPHKTPQKTHVVSSKPQPQQLMSPKSDDSAADEGDEFATAFGVPEKQVKEQIQATPPPKKNIYIPPEPGKLSVKDSLGQGDIMEVVLAHKTKLAKCAEVQHSRNPRFYGKLVMRWTIRPSGKTTGVQVVSKQFKGTYMASCVKGLIQGWTFPRHKKQGEAITFPFKF